MSDPEVNKCHHPKNEVAGAQRPSRALDALAQVKIPHSCTLGSSFLSVTGFDLYNLFAWILMAISK